jgi:hypothetical protein
LLQVYDGIGPDHVNRKGDFYLKLFGFQSGDGWKYGGVVFLGVGYYFFFGLIMTAYSLWSTRHRAPQGTKRHLAVEDDAAGHATAAHGAASPVASRTAVEAGIARVDGSTSPSAIVPSVRKLRAPLHRPVTPGTAAATAVRSCNYGIFRY